MLRNDVPIYRNSVGIICLWEYIYLLLKLLIFLKIKGVHRNNKIPVRRDIQFGRGTNYKTSTTVYKTIERSYKDFVEEEATSSEVHEISFGLKLNVVLGEDEDAIKIIDFGK